MSAGFRFCAGQVQKHDACRLGKERDGAVSVPQLVRCNPHPMGFTTHQLFPCQAPYPKPFPAAPAPPPIGGTPTVRYWWPGSVCRVNVHQEIECSPGKTQRCVWSILVLFGCQSLDLILNRISIHEKVVGGGISVYGFRRYRGRIRTPLGPLLALATETTLAATSGSRSTDPLSDPASGQACGWPSSDPNFEGQA